MIGTIKEALDPASKPPGKLTRLVANMEWALEDLPGGRVSGVVISPSFESLDYSARQTKLSALLKRGLSAEELSAVGAIAALTPAEANVKAI